MSAPIEYNTLEDLPPKPKRALPGFFIYRNEIFTQRRTEFPSLKIPEICSKIGQEYRDMSQEHKQKYEDNSKKDKENCQRLIVEWMEKYGEIERILRDKHKQAKKEESRIQKQVEENYSSSEANEIIRSMKEEKKHLNERLEEALNTITKLRKMNDDLTQENQSLKRLSQMNEIVDPEDPTGKK